MALGTNQALGEIAEIVGRWTRKEPEDAKALDAYDAMTDIELVLSDAGLDLDDYGWDGTEGQDRDSYEVDPKLGG